MATEKESQEKKEEIEKLKKQEDLLVNRLKLCEENEEEVSLFKNCS